MRTSYSVWTRGGTYGMYFDYTERQYKIYLNDQMVQPVGDNERAGLELMKTMAEDTHLNSGGDIRHLDMIIDDMYCDY